MLLEWGLEMGSHFLQEVRPILYTDRLSGVLILDSGQTCLVANPCSSTITRQNADGTWTFIIPRFYDGGTIIGGTKEPHDWNSEAVLTTRHRLLESAAEMYPDILNAEGGFDIITDVVGRRPTREGGMRIEIEKGEHGVTGDGPVVHAYGAGGRGFEISWGVAEEVSILVESVVGGGSVNNARSKM